MSQQAPSLFDKKILVPAIGDAFRKIDPRMMIRNPVMFVTLIGAVLTTVAIFTSATERGFVIQLAIWLWFTVLFANFAEAIAEGRGKAQADSLRNARKDTMARRLKNEREEQVPAPVLEKGDLVVCETGDVIPSDGEVIEGIASVDEAAITGESAPVIRESGGDRSAIGISGIDRLIRRNVMATSGRAVEAAGDIDVLLLDKTGTITIGNRMASDFIPAPGVTEQVLADAAQLSSLADETPEGRSIVVLAKEKFNLRGRELQESKTTFVPFTAQTRMSGVDFEGRQVRKGAADSVKAWVIDQGGVYPPEVDRAVEASARAGRTPLVVADGKYVLGVVELKDVVKGGIKERFAQLRKMGIRTVMITGDNPMTAAAIAAEAGVDDFMAQATPEDKLRRIREEQAAGHLVAMTGDGTNDAPALAQADVGVAMNTGTQAAREAGNMVDLDSNPTKLIEIVEIGKQLLMTRGSLTTFSIANDVAKYFAIIPAMLMVTFPAMAALNIMKLASPQSAILSAVIFNALVIIALIPLALKGVPYKPMGAVLVLRRNLLIYGLGGLIIPFIGIKAIDLVITSLHLV